MSSSPGSEGRAALLSCDKAALSADRMVVDFPSVHIVVLEALMLPNLKGKKSTFPVLLLWQEEITPYHM